MSDSRHSLGRAAEDAVARWLGQHGWRVLERRIRMPGGGEVDMVALDPGGVLVGIEVRARSSVRAGLGSEAIDGRRTARMARTLAAFGASERAGHRGLRLDLVLVSAEPRRRRLWRLRRIPDIGAW